MATRVDVFASVNGRYAGWPPIPSPAQVDPRSREGQNMRTPLHSRLVSRETRASASSRPRLAASALFTAVALLAAGCGGNDSNNSSAVSTPGAQEQATDQEPIKVGAVVSETGTIDFSSTSDGARAYFEKVNSEGGINGRMIEYLVEDDGNDPAKASAAARKLAGEDVVAIIGGGSTVECTANARFYQQTDLFDIPGLGADPGCFSSENIAPANTGPLVGAMLSVQTAIENLGAKRIQYMAVDAPPGRLTDKPVQNYLDSKVESVGPTEFLAPGKDPSAIMVRVKRRNPDAIVLLAPLPIGIGAVKAADAQGIGPAALPWVAATPMYDPATPDTLGGAGEGLHVATEFVPLQAEDAPESVTTFSEAMEEFQPEAKIDSLAQGGWFAADVFTQTLRGMDGEITPAAVTEALKNVESFDNGMTGGEYTIKSRLENPHPPNHWEWIVKIQDGAFVHVADFGIKEFPPPGFTMP